MIIKKMNKVVIPAKIKVIHPWYHILLNPDVKAILVFMNGLQLAGTKLVGREI